jgi:hypothetical protein
MTRQGRVLPLVALLVGLVAATAAAQTPPRAVVEPATRDLGVVGLGTEQTAEYTIRNDGGAPLTIEAHSVPKPLSVALVDSPIAPGKSGRVRLSIDTFRAGVATTWTVSFATSDPARPFLEVQLKADVRQFLAVLPQSARFTFVQYGQEGGTSHVLSAADDAAMQVLGVDSPFPYIKAAWRELAASERDAESPGTKQWRIDLTISGDAPVGPIGGYVIVRTTHKSQPRAFLSVTGFVRPLFAVTPPTARFAPDAPTPGEPHRLSLHVKNFGADALELTGASSDVPGLEATIVPVEAGHVWRVELRLPAGKPAGMSLAGTLKLKTTHPIVREIAVPIVRGPG